MALAEDTDDEQIAQLLLGAETRLATLVPILECSLDGVLRSTLKTEPSGFPKLDIGAIARPYVTAHGEITRVDSFRLLGQDERRMAVKMRTVEDPIRTKQKVNREKQVTAGVGWYNLPRTDLTSELKRDLQLLKMRGVLDRKRHYKKENVKAKAPIFSQVGTIVEGPTEFYSARLQNKDRKQTLLKEVLAGETSTGRFKSKYTDVQSIKSSGKKAHYKSVKAKRSKALRP